MNKAGGQHEPEETTAEQLLPIFPPPSNETMLVWFSGLDSTGCLRGRRRVSSWQPTGANFGFHISSSDSRSSARSGRRASSLPHFVSQQQQRPSRLSRSVFGTASIRSSDNNNYGTKEVPSCCCCCLEGHNWVGESSSNLVVCRGAAITVQTDQVDLCFIVFELSIKYIKFYGFFGNGPPSKADSRTDPRPPESLTEHMWTRIKLDSFDNCSLCTAGAAAAAFDDEQSSAIDFSSTFPTQLCGWLPQVVALFSVSFLLHLQLLCAVHWRAVMQKEIKKAI